MMDSNKKLTSEQIVEIIRKLVGQTDWWGETNKDHESLENLKVYSEIILLLVQDINDKYMDTKGRHEASVQSLNRKYALCLKEIESIIEDAFAEIRAIREREETSKVSNEPIPTEKKLITKTDYEILKQIL